MGLRHVMTVVGMMAALCPVDAADITYSYESDPGEFIGQGLSNSYTDADGTWTVERNFANGVSFGFLGSDPNIWWDLDFAAADGSFLTMGSYPDAMRFGFQDPGHPGLEVTGEGRGCDTLTGEFTVTEVVYDWFCEPARLAASFEQHCEGVRPALTGSVDFDAGLGPLTVDLGQTFVTYANRVYDLHGLQLGRAIPILGCSGSAPAQTEVARDLVVRANGDIEVFTGTFDPVLSSFDAATGTWQHHGYPGWSVANTTTKGGIAAYGDYIYVTDMLSDGNGIVRFDRAAGYAAERFGATDYIDVSISLNGLLYALRSDETTVDVFRPVSMLTAGTASLSAPVNAIAVDARGEIQGASWTGRLYRFAPDGSMVDSQDFPTLAFTDIEALAPAYSFVAAEDAAGYVSWTPTGVSFIIGIGTESSPVFLAVVGPDPADIVIFGDGFESGTLSAWSRG
jgi:hypothetical protein